MQNWAWNLVHRPRLADIIDIIIVAVIVYELLMLTRKTRGSAVLKGLVLLLVVAGISGILGLTALNWILMGVLKNGALVLIILFQPELRKALEQIGRGTVLERNHIATSSDENERIINEIISCLTSLSRRKVGALIVFERKTGLQDVIETGTAVDARITAALLENIFEPNTPLHDGAVVIRNGRVTSAACILTLTESDKVSRDLGTRHRAGIGVTETTDALVLIVSEETGIISKTEAGQITRHLDAAALREILSSIYTTKQRKLVTFRRKKGADRA